MISGRHPAGLSVWVILLSVGWVFGGPGPVEAETQSLHFDGPGWHFISLQIQPTDPRPEVVLNPSASGFRYNHIWGLDSEADGWRHFSPGTIGVADNFNDLTELVPLKGYWVQVAEVPPGGHTVTVDGDPVKLQVIDGQGWHAVGALLPHDSMPRNLVESFGLDETTLRMMIAEIWSYDRQSNSLQVIDRSMFGAPCTSSDSHCLVPGAGYWIRTVDDKLVAGEQVATSTDCLVLSPEEPIDRLRVDYTGFGRKLCLRTTDPAKGVRIVGSSEALIDGTRVLEPDPDDTPRCAGGDPCDGREGCACLDFTGDAAGSAGYESRMTAFVTLDTAMFGQVRTFSNCNEGQEYAKLELYECGGGEARVAASGAASPLATIQVAVRPAIAKGEYSGSLYYDSSGIGEVPIRIIVDDCVARNATGSSSCPSAPTGAVIECSTDRVTGVINPSVCGSSENGVDDDGNGIVDDAGDDRFLGLRNSPALPPDFALHGKLSADGMFLRLEGTMSSIPDLEFARGTGDDRGIAGGFSGSSRSIRLTGIRTGPALFSGRFADVYTRVDLGADEPRAAFEGRFVLSRTQAPRCVANDGTRTLLLDIPCRDANDCPGRCTGDPAVTGFECLRDADCALDTFDPSGAFLRTAIGTCDRGAYSCAFQNLAGASLEHLNHVELVTVRVPGVSVPATVELLGPDRFQGSIGVGNASLRFDDLPCGQYTIRVTAPSATGGCLLEKTFDPCEDAAPQVTWNCPGAQQPPQVGCGTQSSASRLCPRVSKGTVAVTGVAGVGLSAPASLRSGSIAVIGIAGQAAVAGRAVRPELSWTNVLENVFRGTGESFRAIRAGILPIFQQEHS